ncbi:MAG TPA: hypothetical protein VKB53_13940 [Gammaproteobacteria bacterium]|nr:hypothetical protein [Gammaproteobacteria bacterium]
MENNVLVLTGLGVTVDILAEVDATGTEAFGVRLRTFGKTNPKNKMILAASETFDEALSMAIEKAQNGRWENLDWAARPWPKRERLVDRSFVGL